MNTILNDEQFKDEGIERSNLNMSTPGQAVIRRVMAGPGIALTSTGADSGTGDVTVWGMSSTVAVGQICMAAELDPLKYLACDGSTKLRSTYPLLSAITPENSYVNQTSTIDSTIPLTLNYSAAVSNSSIILGFTSGGNTYATSSDHGSTWTSRTAPWSGSIQAAAWNGTVFLVILQNSSAAYTSPDGITWTSRTMPSSQNWASVAWNGTVFCAVAGYSGASSVAATSPDGATWTARTISSSATWFRIAWNGTVFCAIANASSIAATSPDGATWTTQAMPVSTNWQGLTWTGSLFCAVGSNSSIAATSPNGSTWTQRTMPGSSTWTNLASNGSGLVVATAATTASVGAYSLDHGATWTASVMSSRAPFRALTWDGTVFCAFSTSPYTAGTSTDGINWTNREIAASGILSWKPIVGTGTIFCALSPNSTRAATSTDGITWTQQIMPWTSNWAAITYGGGLFCAVGGSTDVITSPDGITWTGRTLGGSATWTDIVWNGSIFCIIGNTSSAYTSSDGATWTVRSMGASNWAAIAWNGTVFCAVGGAATSSNVAATSPDGITWTLQTMPISLFWRDIAWNGSVFCAIAAGNVAAISTNGANWTTVTLPDSVDWQAITWNGSVFCIAAANGTRYATSADGINWKPRLVSAATHSSIGVGSNGSALCIVGDMGGVSIAINEDATSFDVPYIIPRDLNFPPQVRWDE